MRTIERTIYNFDELLKEVQEKLIERQREINIKDYEMYCLYDDMCEYAKELLYKYFGNKASFTDVSYDLSGGQGSGAIIEFDLEYYGKSLEIKRDNVCRYYHKCSFKITEKYYEYLTKRQYDTLHKKIVNMNKELGKYGYDAIDCEYNCEPCNLIRQLDDAEFYEDGTIYAT